MSKLFGNMPRLPALIEDLEMTQDTVAWLVTNVYWQSHIAYTVLLDQVVPRLPPLKRGFPLRVAERIDGDRVFEKGFLEDLNNLITSLEAAIESASHVYWHGDDNHTRGGYEMMFYEPGVTCLQHAVAELVLLREVVAAAIYAARSLRDVPELLNS